MGEPIAAIRACRDLFLQSVTEPDCNEVQVVLLEGRLGRGATPKLASLSTGLAARSLC